MRKRGRPRPEPDPRALFKVDLAPLTLDIEPLELPELPAIELEPLERFLRGESIGALFRATLNLSRFCFLA